MKREALFLDDERWPIQVKDVEYPPGIRWRRVFKVFEMQLYITEILKEMPLYISFDHDLMDFEEGEDITGFTGLKWLCEYCKEKQIPLPICFFHSGWAEKRVEMKMYYDIFAKSHPQGVMAPNKESENVSQS